MSQVRSAPLATMEVTPLRIPVYTSLPEMQWHLQRLVNSITSALIPEDINTSFDFAPLAKFDVHSVGLPPPTTDAPVAKQAPPSGTKNTTPATTVYAHEALSAPTDEKPVLPLLVARAISEAVGHVDGYPWSIRNTYKNREGWMVQVMLPVGGESAKAAYPR